jgi:hypothetical protein
MTPFQRIPLTFGLIVALFSGNALATTIQTSGAGSAVATVEGSADFENGLALNANPYSEGNMVFSRTSLTFDNNGCGFAGCVGHTGFSGFVGTGNYMYGTGNGGFFEITAGGSNTFKGLEFITGSGFSLSSITTFWEAYDAGSSLVGSGSVLLPTGTVIGFSDASGFKRLRFTSESGPSANFTSTFNAPAFDSARGQFSNVSAVPEPSTLLLLGSGLAGVAAWRKKSRA